MVLCKTPAAQAPWLGKNLKRKHVGVVGRRPLSGAVLHDAGGECRAAGHSYHVTKSDEKMIQFVIDAFNEKGCFSDTISLPAEVEECFDWMRQRSALEAMQQRELVTQAIERDASRFLESGVVDDWFGNADIEIRRICKDVNGPLLELLLKISDHSDVKCADLFRYGAPLVGKLPTSGNGRPENMKHHESLESLYTTAAQGNERVLKKMREDPWASELFKMTQADAV